MSRRRAETLSGTGDNKQAHSRLDDSALSESSSGLEHAGRTTYQCPNGFARIVPIKADTGKHESDRHCAADSGGRSHAVPKQPLQCLSPGEWSRHEDGSGAERGGATAYSRVAGGALRQSPEDVSWDDYASL